MIGPVSLGISLGIQLMLSGLMVFGPVVNAKGLERLTRHALALAHPEHDLSIYAAGIAITLLLVIAFSLAWSRVLKGQWWPALIERVLPEDDARYQAYATGLQLGLALTSLAVFFLLLGTRFLDRNNGLRTAPQPLGGLLLLMPGIAAMVCLLLDLRFGFGTVGATAEEPSDIRRRRASSTARSVLDVLMPLLIVMVVFVRPSFWPDLAGNFLLIEEVHSWNFFGMGPALAYRGGGALATDFYSAYGMGWPITFAALNPIVSLTYANLIGIAITFGCVYYIAIYFFLRLLLRDAIWAAGGTILAVMLQLFSGQDLDRVMWMYPSSTMLRHPLDIAFFAAMLMHRRSKRFIWLIVAGAVTGLAVFYELDTGLYLPITFILYWLLVSLPLRHVRLLLQRKLWHPVAGFASTAMIVLTIGLEIGSRGTLFHAGFWTGYLEGLHWQAFSGLGLLPVAGDDDWALLFFALMLVVDLSAVGFVTVRQLFGDGAASEEDLLLACMGAYGLGLLLLFVGRSHPYNLFHPAVPFAVVTTGLCYRVRQNMGRSMAWTSAPWLAAGMLAILLCSKPEFLGYPSLIKSIFVPSPVPGVALGDEPRDLVIPVQYQGTANAIKSLVVVLRHLSDAGETIAILDDLDTPLYCLSGVKPWSRYTSIFPMMLTEDLVQEATDELLLRRPRYVVIRGPAAAGEDWELSDVWKKFHLLLPNHYILDQKIGAYEIWRLPGSI